MSFLPYYEQMLSKGYHVAPMIDHDNHNTTFGKTSFTRTAVLAPTLTETDFHQAMRSRRFYATQDCDTRADLQIHGQPMGSIMSRSFAPSITVTVEDPTNSTSVPSIRMMYGVPGSNVPSTVLATTTGNSLSYTDHGLSNDSTAYYYADILIDGKRTITAPIWYTRKDTTVVNSITTTASVTNSIEIVNNPAKEQLVLSIQICKPTDLQLRIYSSDGKMVYNRTERAVKGNGSYRLPLEHLPEGQYILEMVTDQERLSRKFTHL
jgi:hypothetical protein